MKQHTINTDIIVIGSGIAGLSYALKVAIKYPNKSIHIITKSNLRVSNSVMAQGGIAVVNPEKDTFEKHIEDTINVGGELCNKDVVEMVIKEGPERFYELIGHGASFDTTNNGDFDLGIEAGHSTHRIYHYKDCTGKEIISALHKRVEKQNNIQVLENTMVIDLLYHTILGEKLCIGVKVVHQENVIILTSSSTLLATGGIGQLYKNTTNSSVATGDGIGLAKRIGAQIKNMEFVQFHPTMLYDEYQKSSFLISEAVRGMGAFLRNNEGERFMYRYDNRLELAPRDVVSRAIHHELQDRSIDYVNLDCRHLDKDKFKAHFPNIYQTCLTKGIDPFKELIPVVPAAHYICGGIQVNTHGETSIKNLLAIGECSYTGLHGSNRLASNSLLEALVYAHRAAELDLYFKPPIQIPFQEIPTARVSKIKLAAIKSLLQQVMSNSVGIIRNIEDLFKAERDVCTIKNALCIEEFFPEQTLCELHNMIDTADLIITQALERKYNTGCHFNKSHENNLAIVS